MIKSNGGKASKGKKNMQKKKEISRMESEILVLLSLLSHSYMVPGHRRDILQIPKDCISSFKHLPSQRRYRKEEGPEKCAPNIPTTFCTFSGSLPFPPLIPLLP